MCRLKLQESNDKKLLSVCATTCILSMICSDTFKLNCVKILKKSLKKVKYTIRVAALDTFQRTP